MISPSWSFFVHLLHYERAAELVSECQLHVTEEVAKRYKCSIREAARSRAALDAAQ